MSECLMGPGAHCLVRQQTVQGACVLASTAVAIPTNVSEKFIDRPVLLRTYGGCCHRRSALVDANRQYETNGMERKSGINHSVRGSGRITCIPATTHHSTTVRGSNECMTAASSTDQAEV